MANNFWSKVVKYFWKPKTFFPQVQENLIQEFCPQTKILDVKKICRRWKRWERAGKKSDYLRLFFVNTSLGFISLIGFNTCVHHVISLSTCRLVELERVPKFEPQASSGFIKVVNILHPGLSGWSNFIHWDGVSNAWGWKARRPEFFVEWPSLMGPQH